MNALSLSCVSAFNANICRHGLSVTMFSIHYHESADLKVKGDKLYKRQVIQWLSNPFTLANLIDTTMTTAFPPSIGFAPASSSLCILPSQKKLKRLREYVYTLSFYLYSGISACRRLLLYRKRFEVFRHHLHSQVRLL